MNEIMNTVWYAFLDITTVLFYFTLFRSWFRFFISFITPRGGE